MKKIQQQDGFGVIEALLVLIVVLLVAFIGYYVYHAQHEANKNLSVTADTGVQTKTSAKPKATKVAFDTTVHAVDITLKSPADIAKLPAYTPASFKAFLAAKIKSSQSASDGCVVTYSMSKISQVNIKGGASSADAPNATESGCDSGAPIVWVLTPKNGWDEISGNLDVCVTENGGKVYQEFAQECITNDATGDSANNPNGSIMQLAN